MFHVHVPATWGVVPTDEEEDEVSARQVAMSTLARVPFVFVNVPILQGLFFEMRMAVSVAAATETKFL